MATVECILVIKESDTAEFTTKGVSVQGNYDDAYNQALSNIDNGKIKRSVLTSKKVPLTYKEKATELKTVYGLRNKSEFLKFAQEWNPLFTSFDELNGEALEKLHEYVYNNGEKFEKFIAK